MKLEAFSEVSNLVRHLEGLEARKEQIASAHAKGVDSFLIELRKFNDDGGYYDCHAYMQAHDDAAAITVEELFEVLRVHVASKIEGVKAKLRDLGVNLDEGKRTHPEFVIYEGESYPWDKPTPGDRLPENAIVTERHETSGKALAWAFR